MHVLSFFKGTPLRKRALEQDGYITEEYEFKFDLHDFVGHLRSRELDIDYDARGIRKWLLMNTILYGMNGLHNTGTENGGRRFGALTTSKLRALLAMRVRPPSFDEVLTIAESLPNPMDIEG